MPSACVQEPSVSPRTGLCQQQGSAAAGNPRDIQPRRRCGGVGGRNRGGGEMVHFHTCEPAVGTCRPQCPDAELGSGVHPSFWGHQQPPGSHGGSRCNHAASTHSQGSTKASPYLRSSVRAILAWSWTTRVSGNEDGYLWAGASRGTQRLQGSGKIRDGSLHQPEFRAKGQTRQHRPQGTNPW